MTAAEKILSEQMDFWLNQVMSSCFTTQEGWNLNVHVRNEKKGKKKKVQLNPDDVYSTK